jgi:hypothetical protein
MRKIIDRNEFVKLYQAGMSLKAMGLKYGVSAPTIAHYALKKFGLSPRGRGNRKVMFFENKKDV